MSMFPQTVQKQNLLYYTFIIVILGTPLWWYTTDTYRASLPGSLISQLKHSRVALNIPVAVCFDPSEIHHQRVAQLLISLKPFLLLTLPKVGRVLYDIIPDIAATCSNQPFPVMFTNNVARKDKAELSHNGILRISPDKNLSGIGDDISNHINLNLLHEHVYSVDNPDLHLHNQDVRNAMATATSYNVLVSIVNPDPAKITIGTNLVSGSDTYLKTFLDSIPELSRFTYQTQVLRYIPLSVKPLKYADYFYIAESNLPHLINPIESKLGTSTTNDIHLVIYLVEPKYTPLNIKMSSGHMATSFLSPQWGSVLLYNVGNKTHIDHADTFSILLPQLKQLLGLQACSSSLISPKDRFLMEARATLVHIMRSKDTLNSLISLTESIPNMVIGDHIKDQVNIAISGIEQAEKLLEESDLTGALKHASIARDAAEKSFSDPSILALLYFPDDQKFAIYIPLFLPVGLPLLVAFFELIKERKAAKAKAD